jgi:hypothetical protein
MKMKTFYWIAAYVVVGYGAYYLLTKHQRDIKLINAQGLRTPNEAFLKSADKGYISAWAKAIRNNSAEFFYKGATYLTNGGRVKK